MPKKRFRTPQEKKRLSYKKDHRHAYGESPTSARKTIPKRKKLANRQVRRAAKHLLADDPEAAVSEKMRKDRRRWRKASDAPLGWIVPALIESRHLRHGAKALRRQRNSLGDED